MELQEILEYAAQHDASDILIIAGMPVSFKIGGKLERLGDKLYPEHTSALTKSLYSLAGRDIVSLIERGDDDFSFSLPGICRFRANALRQRGSLGLVIRVISFGLPDASSLHSPQEVMDFASKRHGLVLVTGPAGSGKTTTLACMVDAINSTREAHIITIEDPIEYLHSHKKSVVIQRELYTDTQSYHVALRAALREVPDIILLGEMRDAETISAAVTAAETGHLVISTLHTIGAANTVDRIVDTFPPQQQQPVRTQLAMVLEGVVSQKLMPSVDNGQVPAFEIMKSNSAIRTMIRESKSYQLSNAISSSASEGMMTMDQSILKLFREGKITEETALRYAENIDFMKKMISGM